MKLKQLHELVTAAIEADEANGDLEVYLPPVPGDTIVQPCRALDLGRPTALLEVREEDHPGIRRVLSEGAFLQ